MSVGYINDTTLTGIANAIREKNGESGLYLPSEMAAKIAAIEGSGTIEPLSVTENGTYTAPEGTDGYSPVTVNVDADGEEYTYNETMEILGSSRITGVFVEDEYSNYLSSVFNTEIDMNTDYAVEVAFYANAYIDDGHIVGQNYFDNGNYFHLTTYSSRWYAGSSGTEANFSEDSTNYPLYGADIVFSAKTGDFSMNGNTTVASLTMATRSGYQYCLNTRGGSVSTRGVYKYKYVKIYDAHDNLLCHWVFGHIVVGSTTFYLAYDYVSGRYKLYS